MKNLFLFLLFLCFQVQAKPVELVFWHGMAGYTGDEVRLLADDFNRSQNEFIIKTVYKGDYLETLTSFAAAFRSQQPPAIVQVFEAGTAIMLSPEGVIKPVDQLMKEQGITIPSEDFIPSVREFYSKEGQLMGMPFNLSVPIIYYNIDVLQKVGYSSSNFPDTWAQMEILAKKIKKAGYDCTYTSAYPGWVLFESFLAIHGLPMIQANPVRSAFNTPEFARHFQRLERWQKLHYFRYGGRADDATVLFTSGVCPLFSQSSGAYNSLLALVPFQLGIAAMPSDTQASTKRYANVIGGGALWAVNGQSKKHYKGIAQFFAFIAKPETQKHWHEHTGYLPLGLSGVYAGLLKSDHPTLLLAKKDIEGVELVRSGSYLGPQNQIRRINDEVLEAMFAGLMSSNEALHKAVARSNHLLLRFVRNTQGER